MKRFSLQLAKKRAEIVRQELARLVPNAHMILQYSNNWELFVAVALSAQCTDKRVNIVTKDLFQKYKTLEDYAAADIREFEKDIYSTGFYKNKAKNILAAAKVVKEEFGGVMPKTMEEMRRIPGAGRKTANVVLGNAYGVVEGIAVDTHVHRLAKKFGLTNKNTPEQIEKQLMGIIPKEEWFTFTYKMIDYGRAYSPAHKKAPTDPICEALMARDVY